MKRRYRVRSSAPHAVIGQVGKFDLICFGNRDGGREEWPRVALRYGEGVDDVIKGQTIPTLQRYLSTQRDLLSAAEKAEIIRIAKIVALPVAMGLNVRKFK
jgi:hypothetical protein